jgi:centrosomal protein CEP120
MASPGGDERTHILSIHIQEGRSFGPELQAVSCAATFAGETKLTPYSVGRETHTWNVNLQWRITVDQFRRLSSLGQKDCKVVLTAKDGTKLGWFLVDMRAAKLQAQYKKDEGPVLAASFLTGARRS